MTLWSDPTRTWSDPVLTWGGDVYVPAVPARTFSDVLRGSHTPCTRLHWLDSAGAVQQTWEGGISRTAILTGGDWTSDGTRMVRRSASLVLANPDGDLSPTAPGDPFFGGEWLRIEQGAHVSGVPEYMVTFTGVVTGFTAGLDGALQVTAEDPFTLLAQPLGDSVSVPAGTRVGDALRTLWEPVLGDGSAWSLDDDGRRTTERTWTADAERLTAGVEMAQDAGLEVFADLIGTPVLRPVRDPVYVDSSRYITTNPREATALDLARSGSRLPYNKVVVVVEDPARPTLYATAEVTDYLSPIHKDRIGLRTAPIHRSSGIADQAAANAVALWLLGSYSRYEDRVDGGFFPDIELDAGDVLAFYEGVTGTEDRYLVERITNPVVQGSMSIGASKVIPVLAAVA